MKQKAYDTKRIRGHILEGLRAFYPNGISGGLVFRDMVQPIFPTMEWVDVFQQLAYLHEGSYIEPVEGARFGQSESAKQRMFRLTPKGLDVATGVIDDAAIETEL